MRSSKPGCPARGLLPSDASKHRRKHHHHEEEEALIQQTDQTTLSKQPKPTNLFYKHLQTSNSANTGTNHKLPALLLHLKTLCIPTGPAHARAVTLHLSTSRRCRSARPFCSDSSSCPIFVGGIFPRDD